LPIPWPDGKTNDGGDVISPPSCFGIVGGNRLCGLSRHSSQIRLTIAIKRSPSLLPNRNHENFHVYLRNFACRAKKFEHSIPNILAENGSKARSFALLA